MKKIIYFLFLLLSGLAFGKESYLDFFNLSLYNASDYEIYEGKLQNSSFIFGGRTSCFISDVSFSVKQEKKNFGLSLKTDNFTKRYPCSIKLGNLSVAGSLSKLNNPLLSASSSPFSTSISSTNCITASLPGYSSFSKPETFFLQIGYSDKKNPIKNAKANCYYNPESNEIAFSSLANIKLPWNLLLDFSFTAGKFHLQENTFSSWFTSNDFYYHSGNHNCGNANISLSSKKLSSNFSVSYYESPFGNYDFVYKLENLIKSQNKAFYISGLYNNNISITSSQKTLKDCVQIKTGFSLKNHYFVRNPVFFKTGINFFGNFNLSDTEHNFRISAGVQLTSHITAFTVFSYVNAKIYTAPDFNQSSYFTNVSNFAIQTNFEDALFQLSNIWYFPKVTTTLKTSFSIKPDSNYSNITYLQKYSVILQFSKLCSLTSSVNLNFRDKQLKRMSENSTFQLQIHKNRLKYTCKLNIEWQLDS